MRKGHEEKNRKRKKPSSGRRKKSRQTEGKTSPGKRGHRAEEQKEGGSCRINVRGELKTTVGESWNGKKGGNMKTRRRKANRFSRGSPQREEKRKSNGRHHGDRGKTRQRTRGKAQGPSTTIKGTERKKNTKEKGKRFGVGNQGKTSGPSVETTQGEVATRSEAGQNEHEKGRPKRED